MLAESSHYRSLGVMTPLGVILFLTAWAALTNWGGVWDEVAAQERDRYEATGRYPLGSTRAGKAVRALSRHDDQFSRGLYGSMGLIIGPLFVAIGLAAIFGLL